MALFRRNRTDQTGMPTELQDYYKAEGRERTGLAWLLALGTLLVTVLLVIGLFLGGRWAFRELKNDDKPTQVAVQDDKSDETKNQPSESNTSDDSSPSGNTSQNGGATPAPATPPASGSTPAPQTPPSSSRPSANAPLPSTGPADNVAIFVTVSVLAYIAHRKFLTS